mmetsp:Transcript_3453/g.5760  ORF Transcript_3453/g.5760 Transcript_3453/m.5760 type:complete len:574 (+) Transcript_3453:122-1843(+)|eukprot:CAMPEP_0119018168 /NCGR_PEP_ID=MMETSP1176-20130426/18743_1 /TAXON_ID=265551 /ORGANISM="Synedropsis recta cf, Strain CCMP1620" /LENGTH=573 /DNA_ID=CAMNT_0006972113 /DNA_START=33 /DNA_END=1754 /DNA_ORIENTATION=-
MPGWLKNKLSAVHSVVDDFKDDMVEQVADAVSNVDLGPAVNSLKDAGCSANSLAKETTELCRSTQTKSQLMMGFCGELKDTLTGFEKEGGGGISADAFETIQELMSGEKVQSAMALAKDMNDDAMKCVDKSVEMVTVMEDTMDDLPEPLQKAIDKAMQAKEAPKNQELHPSNQLTTLDRDIGDVQECIKAISELNLFTALKVGLQAFEQFSLKAQVSRDMFDSIRGFSQNVADITDAFGNLDVLTIVKKVKDVWKCLKLSNLMKELAQGLGKLITLVIDLFEATSTKVAGLWKALAFAKDCMKDCIDHAQQAKYLCVDATTKSSTLMDRSIFIKERLQDMGELNAGSIGAFTEIADGEEIKTAILIATEMDDIVLQCTNKAVSMVDRVREGFANLPPMVTDGIPEDAGKNESDPEAANVEDNIVDLEASREAIENANLLVAVQAGTRGFSNVAANVGIAKELLALVQSFAETCMQTIESFMGVWDIKSAIDKVKDMCRIVSLGEMMKQFASQIKRLLLSVVTLMKASIHKFKDIDLSKLNVGDLANQAAEMVQKLDFKNLKKVNLGRLGSFFK